MEIEVEFFSASVVLDVEIVVGSMELVVSQVHAQFSTVDSVSNSVVVPFSSLAFNTYAALAVSVKLSTDTVFLDNRIQCRLPVLTFLKIS